MTTQPPHQAIMLSRLLLLRAPAYAAAAAAAATAGSRARSFSSSSSTRRATAAFLQPCPRKQLSRVWPPSSSSSWLGPRVVPLSARMGRGQHSWAVQMNGGGPAAASGTKSTPGTAAAATTTTTGGSRRGLRVKAAVAKGPVVVAGPHRGLPLEALEGRPALVREELVALARELAAHDDLYYNRDEPLISDAEYDELVGRLEQLETRHPDVVRSLREEEGYVSRSERVGAPPPSTLATPFEPSVAAALPPVGARFAPVTHTRPMQSLDNAFSPEDVVAWAARLAKVLQEAGGIEPGTEEEEEGEERELEYVAELKIDGVSLSLRYEHGRLVRGATRGNGVTGEDVTANVLAMATAAGASRDAAAIPTRLGSAELPCPPMVEVRGEVFLSRAAFQALNEARAAAGQPLLSNPRNAASGSLRQLDPAETGGRGLGFFAYAAESEGDDEEVVAEGQGALLERLAAWGFAVARPWARCKGTAALLAFHAQMEAQRARLPFDVDGVVYKLAPLALRRRAGSSARAPRWALAHKFSPVEARTRVERVEVQVGRTGVLTPVAVLAPVTVGGVVIGRATLHNFQDLARKDVREGDEVLVRRAGDVIPQVLGRANNNATATEEDGGERPAPYSPPTACPSCGGPVSQEEDQAGLYCPAGLSCPAQSLERLVHFVSRDAFDIKGLGGRRVEELMAWGLLSGPVDLFALEEKEAARTRAWEAAAGKEEEKEEKEGVPVPLAERDGWGARSTEVLFQAVAARRRVSLGRFIYALGIRHVGQTTARAIGEHFGSVARWWAAMQALRAAPVPPIPTEDEDGGGHDEEEEEDGADGKPKKKRRRKKAAKAPALEAAGLETIEGIGPIVIGSLRAFALDDRNCAAVEALLRVVEVTDEGGSGPSSSSAGSTVEAGEEQLLEGQAVLFTGTLASMTRSEAEEAVRQRGGRPVKTLSKKVAFVVAGDDPGSKLRKARELGVPVLTEAEWLAKLDKGPQEQQ